VSRKSPAPRSATASEVEPIGAGRLRL
jgi:hypothetical protein